MAKFQEVMRQWRRMCKYCSDNAMDGRHGRLDVCSLCCNAACGDIENATDEDIKAMENAIKKWAAEHPEPVYPTWYEFLTKRYHKAWEAVGCDSIPADLAEKLGLQPKEG